MRRSAVAVVSLAAAASVFVACSERDSTNSRGPLTAAATTSFSLVPATTCNFEAIESAAHAYFSSPNGVLAIGEQMEADRNVHHSAAAANADGFAMLREVAKSRLTTSAKAGATAAGATFVIDVLRCTISRFRRRR